MAPASKRVRSGSTGDDIELTDGRADGGTDTQRPELVEREHPAAGYAVNEELSTDDVRRELATVLTMAANGHTDDGVVEVVAGDPGMGSMAVTAEASDDPVKRAGLRGQLLHMVEEGDLPQ
ncbi:hypothetical protein [Streptomyces sp. NPDC020983]|uniref:hypothetical protein n=1 Tax=Streptomyces sp. NPDC020983 TaxID=3365106 RepID=UPI003796DA49